MTITGVTPSGIARELYTANFDAATYSTASLAPARPPGLYYYYSYTPKYPTSYPVQPAKPRPALL